MTCNETGELLGRLADGSLDDARRRRALAHVERCDDCRAALRGAEALVEIRQREVPAAPPHLFDTVVEKAVSQPAAAARDHRFWTGAGFGALAASLLAVALFFGFAEAPAPTSATPEFVVSLDEPRNMNIAFETDRRLDGATITILLSGDVEIDGYGPQRELSWSDDLDAGVNRLSLPVIANGLGGGQIIVRLEHPQSEQLFVVTLPVES
ncbi:MAG: zf-HC2 domain-containing protein [Woeseiaceae bacterium]|jgi:hypothetical protein|nr:zf-HC2 domain-containing protein [Woeseiaceae bacterium]